jgi:hypothetical protein
VVAAAGHVLVTEWMDGTPLAEIIDDGTTAERNRAGIMIVRFLFSSPERVGLLHADPHPGNFRLLADGRLGVLDFGAVDRLPGGLPPFFGKTVISKRSKANSGHTVFSGKASALTWRRCKPSWPRSPCPPRWTRSSSAVNGCAMRRGGWWTRVHPALCGGSTCRPRTY